MGRSIKTAEIISDIIRVHRLEVFDLMRDRNLGAGEGMTTAKIMDVFGLKFTNILDNTINLLPGAESVENLKSRVKKARNILYRDYKGKNVLAISHGGFIRMFYKIYIGDPHSIRFTNCSFIKVRPEAEYSQHDSIYRYTTLSSKRAVSSASILTLMNEQFVNLIE